LRGRRNRSIRNVNLEISAINDGKYGSGAPDREQA
jgi:hypothetical protein